MPPKAKTKPAKVPSVANCSVSSLYSRLSPLLSTATPPEQRAFLQANGINIPLPKPKAPPGNSRAEHIKSTPADANLSPQARKARIHELQVRQELLQACDSSSIERLESAIQSAKEIGLDKEVAAASEQRAAVMRRWADELMTLIAQQVGSTRPDIKRSSPLICVVRLPSQEQAVGSKQRKSLDGARRSLSEARDSLDKSVSRRDSVEGPRRSGEKRRSQDVRKSGDGRRSFEGEERRPSRSG